jgi:hypothetical protein
MVIVMAEEIGESALLRDWAYAECSNPDRWSQHGLTLPQELVQRLREGLRVEEPQWLALETEMRRFRSPCPRRPPNGGHTMA